MEDIRHEAQSPYHHAQLHASANFVVRFRSPVEACLWTVAAEPTADRESVEDLEADGGKPNADVDGCHGGVKEGCEDCAVEVVNNLPNGQSLRNTMVFEGVLTNMPAIALFSQGKLSMPSCAETLYIM